MNEFDVNGGETELEKVKYADKSTLPARHYHYAMLIRKRKILN